VIAYAGLLCPPGSGEADVQTIAVVPEQRSAGLGRRLMNALLQTAEERRARRIFLEVRADNPRAIALYASLGFEEIAIRPGYYQPEGVDAVMMRRA
jgi:ribosomal-protein-alanine N-acetyltransferase